MAKLTAKIISNRGRDNGIQRLYVEVWVKNASQDYLLGSAVTNGEGNFEIPYESGDLKPDRGDAVQQVYFKIYQSNDLLKTTEGAPVALGDRAYPDIPIEGGRVDPTSAYRVKGIIATPKGRGIGNLIVRALNKTTRGETMLSEGKTNNKGEYLIYYKWDNNIGREGAGVDLVVKAYENINEDTPVITSPLIINALPEEVINLSVGKESYRGLDVYTMLHETLEDSLKEAAVNDLSVREVLILANTHDLEPTDTSFYIQSRQWAAQWEGLPAEVYFGWFKTGLPTNWTDILNTSVEDLVAALDTALEENFIPESAESEKRGIEQKIQQWRTDNLVMARGEHVERGSVGELLAASRLEEGQRKKLVEEWQTFEGSVDEFWKKQETDLGADNYHDLELTLQLGTVTRNHLPLITAIKGNANIHHIQDIAALETEDWLSLMEEGNMEVPEDIPGEDTGARRKEFASQLKAITEEMLPTAVLARSFKTDSEVESGVLDNFMEKNPSFEFRNTTVRAYLKENPEALADVDDKDAAQRELEAVQRIFHLTPSRDKYTGAKVLWENKLHSAYAIKMAGLETIKELFGDNEELAENIFYRADMRHSRIKMAKMQLQSVSNSLYALSRGRQDLLKDMDDAADLEALFGDQGYCQCKHCDSFFSPAAYLTDIFLFLNKAKVTAKNPAPDEDTVLERLFKRRPDLGNIQLDCENSHTPIPYIDLVNEILEMAIAPHVYQDVQVKIFGKTYTLPVAQVPQTETDAPTLKAYPQYLKQEAYDILNTGESRQGIGFPWILPFNLWMLEVRTYLEHLGVSRAQLMESIVGGIMPEEVIATEYLKLLPKEREILNDTIANETTTQKYWGTNLAELIKVPVFLKQTGYSYEALVKLLQMRYIQHSASIVFNPPSSCSVSKATIPSLTHAVLSRIHKFGRLMLRTGEEMLALDRTILTFDGNIDDQFLVNFSNLLKVEKLVKNKPDRKEILSWWAPIDRMDYKAEPSLYTRLFMMPASMEAFQLNENKDELATPGVLIDPKAPLQESDDLLAVLLSITRLKAADLELLIEEEFPGKVITLNLAQLSYLYRTASFCRALKLKVSEYLALKNLFGFQPIAGISQEATPAMTLNFIKRYDTLIKAALEPELLDYILRHHSRPNGPFTITENEIENILKPLQEKILLQLNEILPSDTTIRHKVETQLRLLMGIKGDEGMNDVLQIMNIIGANSGPGPQVLKDIIEEKMFFLRNKQEAKAKLVWGEDIDAEARFEYLGKTIDRYLIENTIVSELAGSLELPVDITESLLKKLFIHPSDTNLKAVDVFFEDNFTSADAKSVWTASVLAAQFTVMIRLHKLSLLINLFKFSLSNIVFLMQQGNGAGLPDLNALPIEQKANADEIEKWMNLFELVNLNKEVFKGGTTVFDVLEMAQDGESATEDIIQRLSDATWWKQEDLQYLTGNAGLNLSFPQDYQSGEWLIKIAEVLTYVNRVGATARQMASWTATNITKIQADSVRNAAKAKYGEQQWQEVTVPLRNNIREVQRDALVQYVLHYGKKYDSKPFEDIDDIYGYYLIDTQMAACTDTSRIVLAASSVQLFVQRIMMNLELSMSLSAEFTKEWKWRKYYRVWEANRKVFMWPENWIEPELRDDKTPLFKELENELLQGELNAEIVERAYINYLEKLHEVSHLNICGMYHDSVAFHVIAHTSGKPFSYHYRRWENRFQWTPWEKIELDIFNGEEIDGKDSGTLLVPVVHNRRLFLFWPLFKLKKEPPTPADEDTIGYLKTEIDFLNSKVRKIQREIDRKTSKIKGLEDKKTQIKDLDGKWDFIDLGDFVNKIQDQIDVLYIEIEGEDGKGGLEKDIRDKKAKIREKEEEIREIEQGYLRYQISMAWSQHRDGMWTPKKESEDVMETPLFIEKFREGATLKNYMVVPVKSDDGTLRLRIIYTISKKVYRFTSEFEYDDCKSKLVYRYNWLSKNKYQEEPEFKQSMDFMKVNTSFQPLSIVSGYGDEILLLEKTFSEGKVIRSYQTDLYKSHFPFFYEDNTHSFFISTPSVNSSRGKTVASAMTAALKSGTNMLRQSVMKPAENLLQTSNSDLSTVSSDRISPVSSGIEFADRNVSTTSFFEAAHSNQVIVRANEPQTLSALSRAKVSFGRGPSKTTHALSHIKNKFVYDINGYEFFPFYHPYTCLFLQETNRYGIEGLLNPTSKTVEGRELLHQETPSHKNTSYFKDKYKPNLSEVVWTKAKEEIDFEHGGVYATYNWELFYHIPLYIATRLSQDQRFDEAQHWFHYIFDPTEADGEVPYRFWKIKPFHTYTITEIKKDIEAVMKGGDKIKKQIQAWEENPFNPHLLARFRRLAYMKTVVIKYLDNLIAWGDQLFRRDSVESLNEATQLYLLAGQILGKLPVETEAKSRASKSFNDLAAKLTEMGNAWVNMENMITDEYEEAIADKTEGSRREYFQSNKTHRLKDSKTKIVKGRASSGILDDILYFCMSPNEKLLSYWDTVADRLFKIRNCMNIEGIVRNVPLFQPPIDPALLVKAVAAGVDISSAINNLFAPMPHYRFNILIQKATELCQELKSFGNALLSAIQNKDGDELALMRTTHEIQLLEANKDIRKAQIEESRLAEAALIESQKLANIRYNNYSNRDYMNIAEGVAMGLSWTATGFQVVAGAAATTAAAAVQIPDIKVSTHAQGLSSGTTVEIHSPGSGEKNKESAMSVSKFFELLATVTREASGMISTLANYDRREEEWALQIELAEQEIMQIAKQILGAAIRKEIAEKEKENLDLQIENAKQINAYMTHKYSNQELYNWLCGQISSVYFQTYKMVYDLAKQAERAFQFELGIESSNYIQFGYWDNLKKGLLSGEKLSYDLKRLELAYLEKNKREYEITKHISVSLINPTTLLKLKETGMCEFDIPELLFDLDFSGQYFRRIKSVSITIPCIVGPYTNVSVKLTLLKNRIRKNGSSQASYTYTGIEDSNFIHDLVGMQSVATSQAQGDSGLFELNFRDDRYLPFEGAGAISSWRLELPTEFRSFDYNTISDVILHMNYTAREGGDALKQIVNSHINNTLNKWMDEAAENETGLLRLISMKQAFPNEWYHFFSPQSVGEGQPVMHLHQLIFEINKQHFPYFLRDRPLSLLEIKLVLKLKNEEDNDSAIGLPVELYKGKGISAIIIDPATDNGMQPGIANLPTLSYDLTEDPMDWWKVQLDNTAVPVILKEDQPNNSTIPAPLDQKKIEDMYLILRYQI